jgi:hypothetical protein
MLAMPDRDGARAPSVDSNEILVVR